MTGKEGVTDNGIDEFTSKEQRQASTGPLCAWDATRCCQLGGRSSALSSPSLDRSLKTHSGVSLI